VAPNSTDASSSNTTIAAQAPSSSPTIAFAAAEVSLAEEPNDGEQSSSASVGIAAAIILILACLVCTAGLAFYMYKKRAGNSRAYKRGPEQEGEGRSENWMESRDSSAGGRPEGNVSIDINISPRSFGFEDLPAASRQGQERRAEKDESINISPRSFGVEDLPSAPRVGQSGRVDGFDNA